MAITTGDGLLAGMRPRESFIKATGTMEAAGVFASLFYTAGRPGAAVAPTPGLAGAALTTYAGQMPWTNPTGGALSYLARVFASAGVAGSLFVCDRLWHNSGIVVTTTTAQTVNSVAWPARDRDGSTNGADVMVALEVSAATTNGAAVTNMTMSYTDDGGTAGNTGRANLPNFPATAAAGSFIPFSLDPGDTGVRSIQSITLGTSLVAGTVHLVAYRVLAEVPVPIANVPVLADAVALGMPQLWDNTVPFLVWLPTATTTTQVVGSLTYAQG